MKSLSEEIYEKGAIVLDGEYYSFLKKLLRNAQKYLKSQFESYKSNPEYHANKAAETRWAKENKVFEIMAQLDKKFKRELN